MRAFAFVGALMAGLGVAFGAFGSHALRELVTPARLDTFETAVRYQLVHAVALLALGLGHIGRTRLLALGGWTLVAGSAVFCLSLYLLVLTDRSWLGAVAPLGGVLLIGGWVLLMVAIATTVRPLQARRRHHE